MVEARSGPLWHDDTGPPPSVSLDGSADPARPAAGRRPPSRRTLLWGGAATVVGAVLASRLTGDRILPPAPDASRSHPPVALTGQPRRPGGLAPLTFTPLVDGPSGGAYSAHAILGSLAAAVAARADDTGHGRYAYVALRTWTDPGALSGTAAAGPLPSPVRLQAWRAADGTGQVCTGEIDHPSCFATYQTPGPDGSTATWPYQPLSADPSKLAAQLVRGAPTTGGEGVPTLALVEQLFRTLPLHPAVRAATLRVIGDLSGLVLLGTGRDRQGRPGLAVAVDDVQRGVPVQRVLVLDPVDGRALGSEVVTRARGAVWTSTVWLDVHFTDHLT